MLMNVELKAKTAEPAAEAVTSEQHVCTPACTREVETNESSAPARVRGTLHAAVRTIRTNGGSAGSSR